MEQPCDGSTMIPVIRVKSPSGNLVSMTTSWPEITRTYDAYARRLTQIPRLSPVLCLLARLDSLVDLAPKSPDKLGCLVGILCQTTGQTQIP